MWAQSSSTGTPAPLNGVIDLKGYQLEDDLTIPLNGDWFLTWDKLLTPKPWAVLKTEATGTIPVPGNWSPPSQKNRFSDSSAPMAATGKATYFLRVINHSGPLPGFRIPGVSSAARVFLCDGIWKSLRASSSRVPRKEPRVHYTCTARCPAPRPTAPYCSAIGTITQRWLVRDASCCELPR